MWRCSNMSNILLEDIFDSELDKYYREFSKEETFEYIDKLKEHNNIENQKYLKALFNALGRGVQVNKVFLAECTANEFIGKLQYMTSSLLLPFSGIGALEPYVNKLYYYLTNNSSLDALSIGGVYIPRKDKLFVFIKSSKLKDYKIHSDKLLYVLLHEMCHLYAKTQPKSFKSIFWSSYIFPFYKAFFKNLNNEYNLNVPDKVLLEYTKIYAESLLEMESVRNYKKLSTMYKTLDKLHTKLTYLVYTLFLNVYTEEEFKAESELYLAEVFHQSYKDIGIHLPNVFKLYQEILFPSEIVCISAFVNNQKPEYIKMLNTIFI